MSYSMNEEDNLGVDCVQSDPHYDLKNCFQGTDSEESVYCNVQHSCRYYEIDDFVQKFSHEARKFSTLSFNVRSLPGSWVDFRDLMRSVNKNNSKLSVVAVQEVWNVPLGLHLTFLAISLFSIRLETHRG